VRDLSPTLFSKERTKITNERKRNIISERRGLRVLLPKKGGWLGRLHEQPNTPKSVIPRKPVSSGEVAGEESLDFRLRGNDNLGLAVLTVSFHLLEASVSSSIASW
jgi:hypothetical protein